MSTLFGYEVVEQAQEIDRLSTENATLQAEIDSLTAEIASLRSALKPRVSNVSEDQVAAGPPAWDDCHDGEQADSPMRSALEASHLIFVRRALQIAANTRAALQPKEGEG